MAPIVCTEESRVERSTSSNDHDNSNRQICENSSTSSLSVSSSASTYSVIMHNGGRIRRNFSKAASPYFIPISNQKDKIISTNNHCENSNSSMDSEFANDDNERKLALQEATNRRENRSASVSSSSGCSSIMEESLQSASCRCNSLHTSDYDEEDCESQEDSAISPNSVLSAISYKHCRGNKRLSSKHLSNARNSKSLVEIAMRTIKLMQRNQELQNKLYQLQQETNCFIRSVMANPENKNLQKS
uniref:CSON015436 protein n=1 Tax=Culicoides sonorensis TaxID=179676 RepID=A0A336K4K0_CULSO